MEVSEGTVKEIMGDTDSVSLQENISLDGQLIPGAAEVLGNPWDLLEVVRPSTEGRQYRVLYTGSQSTMPLIASSLSVDSWKCWII